MSADSKHTIDTEAPKPEPVPPWMEDNPHYWPSKMREYKGNPVAECIRPLPASDEKLIKSLTHAPYFNKSELKLPNNVRILLPERLLDVFIGTANHLPVLKWLFRRLLGSYRSPVRNPMSPEGQHLLHYGTPPAIILPGKIGMLTALSGMGKSALVRNSLLSFGKPVIRHHAYHGKAFTETQILYLLRDAPAQSSLKMFAQQYGRHTDALLGQKMYGKLFSDPRQSRDSLVDELGNIVVQHFIGLLVVDLAENLTAAGLLSGLACESLRALDSVEVPNATSQLPSKEDLIRSLERNSYSICATASHWNLSRNGVLDLSLRMGICIPLNAEATTKLGNERLREVKCCIRNGMTYTEITQRFDLSPWMVKRIRSSDPTLMKKRGQQALDDSLACDRQGPTYQTQQDRTRLGSEQRQRRTTEAFDVQASAAVHRVAQKLQQSKGRLTETRLLSAAGVFTRYRLNRERYPKIAETLLQTVETEETYHRRKVAVIISERMACPKPVTLDFLHSKISPLDHEARDIIIRTVIELHAPVAGKLAEEVNATRGKKPAY